MVLTFYKNPRTTFWIEECYQLKEKYARGIATNKIVIAAGSNALFGLNAKLIERELNIPCVNMAVNAGLKTDYILYKAQQVLKLGDTIILPMEYENILWDGEYIETRGDQVLGNDMEFFFSLPFSEQFELALSQTLFDIRRSLKRQRKFKRAEQKMDLAYDPRTFTENGDVTENNGSNLEKVQNRVIFEVEGFKETKALKIIKNFNDWCSANNIVCYVSFPNIYAAPVLSSPKHKGFFNEYEAYLLQNDIPYLGEPSQFMYPAELFLDTEYHTNKAGTMRHMLDIIDFLRKKGL